MGIGFSVIARYALGVVNGLEIRDWLEATRLGFGVGSKLNMTFSVKWYSKSLQ